jgi:hypothetical protein
MSNSKSADNIWGVFVKNADNHPWLFIKLSLSLFVLFFLLLFFEDFPSSYHDLIAALVVYNMGSILISGLRLEITVFQNTKNIAKTRKKRIQEVRNKEKEGTIDEQTAYSRIQNIDKRRIKPEGINKISFYIFLALQALCFVAFVAYLIYRCIIVFSCFCP